jgi:hypothetical protein
MREEHERIERQTQVLAFDDGAHRRGAGVDLFPVSLEPFVVVGARERDEAAGLVAREKDACLLEQLAGGRDVIGDGVLRRQARQPLSRTVNAVAPFRAAVVI